jgi:hypothetical protein
VAATASTAVRGGGQDAQAERQLHPQHTIKMPAVGSSTQKKRVFAQRSQKSTICVAGARCATTLIFYLRKGMRGASAARPRARLRPKRDAEPRLRLCPLSFTRGRAPRLRSALRLDTERRRGDAGGGGCFARHGGDRRDRSLSHRLQADIACACARRRRFGALCGRVPRRSCANDRATSRNCARVAASARVQSITSRCA